MDREELFNILLSYIGKEVTVYIDREIGYHHKGIVYELNYGYIKDIISLDNEYQDAYIIDSVTPLKEVKGTVIAVIKREDDIEDKLVVSISNQYLSKEEIENRVNFQEKYFKHHIVNK